MTKSIQNAAGLLLLFPGALGDFCCLWPTIAALRALRVGVTVCARPAWLDLLPECVPAVSLERREITDLFAAGPLRGETLRFFGRFDGALSWSGSGDPAVASRLAAAVGGPARVFPFRAMRGGEHAAEYYARCAGVAPLDRPLPVRAAARGWAEDWERRLQPRRPLLAVHPGSGSPAKNWQGIAEITRWWPRATGGGIVLVVGPAEIEAGTVECGRFCLAGERLDRVAAVLQRADAYLGNDSGITHLAGLVRVPGVALFGPTDPRVWGPRGGRIEVLAAADACGAGCAPTALCVHRIAVEAVQEALLRKLEAAAGA